MNYNYDVAIITMDNVEYHYEIEADDKKSAEDVAWTFFVEDYPKIRIKRIVSTIIPKE